MRPINGIQLLTTTTSVLLVLTNSFPLVTLATLSKNPIICVRLRSLSLSTPSYMTFYSIGCSTEPCETFVDTAYDFLSSSVSNMCPISSSFPCHLGQLAWHPNLQSLTYLGTYWMELNRNVKFFMNLYVCVCVCMYYIWRLNLIVSVRKSLFEDLFLVLKGKKHKKDMLLLIVHV